MDAGAGNINGGFGAEGVLTCSVQMEQMHRAVFSLVVFVCFLFVVVQNIHWNISPHYCPLAAF